MRLPAKLVLRPHRTSPETAHQWGNQDLERRRFGKSSHQVVAEKEKKRAQFLLPYCWRSFRFSCCITLVSSNLATPLLWAVTKWRREGQALRPTSPEGATTTGRKEGTEVSGSLRRLCPVRWHVWVPLHRPMSHQHLPPSVFPSCLGSAFLCLCIPICTVYELGPLTIPTSSCCHNCSLANLWQTFSEMRFIHKAVKQNAKWKGNHGRGRGEWIDLPSFTEAGLGVPLQGSNWFPSSLEAFQCVVGQILVPLF